MRLHSASDCVASLHRLKYFVPYADSFDLSITFPVKANLIKVSSTGFISCMQEHFFLATLLLLFLHQYTDAHARVRDAGGRRRK